VKEKKGALGRATDLAAGAAATMRRIARDREPRVLLYDAAGHARLLQPEARGHARALELSEQMVALVGEAEKEEAVAAKESRPARDGA
jgi:hypothetical protein